MVAHLGGMCSRCAAWPMTCNRPTRKVSATACAQPWKEIGSSQATWLPPLYPRYSPRQKAWEKLGATEKRRDPLGECLGKFAFFSLGRQSTCKGRSKFSDTIQRLHLALFSQHSTKACFSKAAALRILGGKDGLDTFWPFDPECGVIPEDAALMGGGVIVRGFVEELRSVREHDKAVGKAFGYPKLALVFR